MLRFLKKVEGSNFFFNNILNKEVNKNVVSKFNTYVSYCARNKNGVPFIVSQFVLNI